MNRNRRAGYLGGIGLALLLSGCQTWMGGTTLPSPHYLDHPPQYIPPSPPFPLTRELATMESQGAVGAAVGPIPAPAPPPVPPAAVAPPPVP